MNTPGANPAVPADRTGLSRWITPVVKIAWACVLPLLWTACLTRCRHGRTNTWERANTPAKSQETTAERLANLEKELVDLRKEVAKKNEILGKLAALGKKAESAGTSRPGSGSGPAASDAPRTRTPSPSASRAPSHSNSYPAGRRMGLQMRILGYRSGRMIVELYNPGLKVRRFSPKGLYFVPLGDSKRAPQRMGASGPYEVWQLGAWRDASGFTPVPPNGSAKVRLQVFCLDQSRSSPADGQRFRLARSRMSRPLQRAIDSGTRRILRGRAFRRAPRAKPKVQRHIWRMRKAHAYPMDGD